MSKPVATLTHSMFLLTAHWAGMEVRTPQDLPCWLFDVLDPELGVTRSLYIHLAKNPEYEGTLDAQTVLAARKELIKPLAIWYTGLGVDSDEAHKAAGYLPVWQVDWLSIPELGSLQAVKQNVMYKMQFGPLFKLLAYRKLEHLTVECRSNIFGKVTVGGEQFAWFLEPNERSRKLIPFHRLARITLPSMKEFSAALNDEFIRRWPYFDREAMADVRPKFEVMSLIDFNREFPRTRMILDLDGL